MVEAPCLAVRGGFADIRDRMPTPPRPPWPVRGGFADIRDRMPTPPGMMTPLGQLGATTEG